MYFGKKTSAFTEPSWARTEQLNKALETADAIVVGAGAGLSTSSGLHYSGPRFETHFEDFIEKYHFPDMYTAGFYPYPTPEEYWAYWSRHIYWNRYDRPVGEAYRLLLELVGGREYFVLTTNVDHCFQDAGFDEERIFATQGDYGLWQCSLPCCERTFGNEEAVRRMVELQRDMRIPTELVPKCPACGRPMAMHLRCDDRFVQDAAWYAAQARCTGFLSRHRTGRVVYLELGVGGNTPAIIKYPFWRFTRENPDAVYACINPEPWPLPVEIAPRALWIGADIRKTLEEIIKSRAK